VARNAALPLELRVPDDLHSRLARPEHATDHRLAVSRRYRVAQSTSDDQAIAAPVRGGAGRATIWPIKLRRIQRPIRVPQRLHPMKRTAANLAALAKFVVTGATALDILGEHWAWAWLVESALPRVKRAQLVLVDVRRLGDRASSTSSLGTNPESRASVQHRLHLLQLSRPSACTAVPGTASRHPRRLQPLLLKIVRGHRLQGFDVVPQVAGSP
jgi:hypothetical protein